MNFIFSNNKLTVFYDYKNKTYYLSIDLAIQKLIKKPTSFGKYNLLTVFHLEREKSNIFVLSNKN